MFDRSVCNCQPKIAELTARIEKLEELVCLRAGEYSFAHWSLGDLRPKIYLNQVVQQICDHLGIVLVPKPAATAHVFVSMPPKGKQK